MAVDDKPVVEKISDASHKVGHTIFLYYYSGVSGYQCILSVVESYNRREVI